MARWHFCNSTQFLCLGSQSTRSQKWFYALVDKKPVPKTSICLDYGESKPKTHIFGLKWQRTGAKMRTPLFGLGCQRTGAKMRTPFSFSSSPRSPFLSTTPFLSSLSLQPTPPLSLPPHYSSHRHVIAAGSLHLHFLFPWLNFICWF